MHKLEVGQLYVPERTLWPEGVEYNWYDNGHELRIFLADPMASERKIFDLGCGSFAQRVYARKSG